MTASIRGASRDNFSDERGGDCLVSEGLYALPAAITVTKVTVER